MNDPFGTLGGSGDPMEEVLSLQSLSPGEGGLFYTDNCGFTASCGDTLNCGFTGSCGNTAGCSWTVSCGSEQDVVRRIDTSAT